MISIKSRGRVLFDTFNHIFLFVFSFLCVIPIVHVFAISLSSNNAVMAKKVFFWPVDFTLVAYDYIFKNGQFWRAFEISVIRVVFGGLISMVLVILAAYPLSKEVNEFKGRTFYAWAFFITMLFNGGIIPTFMVIRQLDMLNTIWALLLPNAVNIFNVILLLNFFRQVPREMSEAATIDGAGQWRVLINVYLPVSKHALATTMLYTIVSNWNAWFDGIIYMNKADMYPLQSYLRYLIVEKNLELMSDKDIELLLDLSERTLKAAQIFVAAIPVLAVYPFLQKYFVKGMFIGSVKG